MADVSLFSILTFQRRPGLWRASISPKVSAGPAIKGTMLGFVTEDDCDSEEAAETAAKRAIKKL